MDDKHIPQASDQVAKAASVSGHAGHQLKSAKTAGSTLKKLWEWAEHIHFGLVLCTTILPAVFLAIKNFIVQMIRGAAPVAQALEYAAHSFWTSFVLTAPLTFAVAVILVSIRRKWFNDTPVVRVPFAGIVLVASAYLSGWSGIGKAFDWQDVVARSAWDSAIPMWSMLMEWFRLPFFASLQYWQIYPWDAFLLSVVAGCFLGSVVKEKDAAPR